MDVVELNRVRKVKAVEDPNIKMPGKPLSQLGALVVHTINHPSSKKLVWWPSYFFAIEDFQERDKWIKAIKYH